KKMKHLRPFPGFVAALLLSLPVWSARGAILTWTNTSGGNWSVADNWSPNQIPGQGDFATITNAGSYVVTVVTSGTLDGLQLGGNVGSQRLVVNQPLSCGGPFAVSSSAILDINAYFQSGQLTLGGTLNWQSDYLTASINVATNGVLNITGDLVKTL